MSNHLRVLVEETDSDCSDCVSSTQYSSQKLSEMNHNLKNLMKQSEKKHKRELDEERAKRARLSNQKAIIENELNEQIRKQQLEMQELMTKYKRIAFSAKMVYSICQNEPTSADEYALVFDLIKNAANSFADL